MKFLSIIVLTALTTVVLSSCGGSKVPGSQNASTPKVDLEECLVYDLTSSLRSQTGIHQDFYTKFAYTSGVTIVTSDKVSDFSILRACEMTKDMLSVRPDLHPVLRHNSGRLVIISEDEKVYNVPEFADLGPEQDYRSRGLFRGSLSSNVALCAEENLMCSAGDRWVDNAICVHEMMHLIVIGGLMKLPTPHKAHGSFENRLDLAYSNAMSSYLWRNTYLEDSKQEYIAMAAQFWYNAATERRVPDGVYGPVNTRNELLINDPDLYDLVSEVLPNEPSYTDCYATDQQ